jgi:hypothetical protein
MTKDGTTIKLNKPITVSGAKVTALVMREPTVADQLAMDKMEGTDGEKELAYFASLCMQAPSDLHQLTIKDYKQLQEAFKAFVV